MAILEGIAQGALNYGIGMAASSQQQQYNRETMALQFGYNSMMQKQAQNNRLS